MEKITLRYEVPDDASNPVVEFTFDCSGMNVYDFANELQHFMYAIGYHPDSVNKVFQEY